MSHAQPHAGAWKTLVDVLEHRASQSPDQRAYTFLERGEQEAGSLTYAQLAGRARRIAAQLRPWNPTGERVLLLFPQGLDFIEAFFGCLYAGAIPVPALPARRGQALARLQGIAGDAEPRLALTTPALLSVSRERLSEVAPGVRVESVAEAGHSGAEEPWDPPSLAPDDTALLQYTSGSTGTPRGVVVTHANILHNQHFIMQRFEFTPRTVAVSWLPMFHDMGLIGMIMQPLYVGFPCILMSPEAFLQKPRRWLAALTYYRATMTGGPNFAYDFCVDRIAPAERAGLDLSAIRLAYNGSEPVRAQTLERFAQAYEPYGFDPAVFYPCYGLAEATLLVSGGKPGRTPVVLDVDAADLEQHRIRASTAPEAAGRRLVSCGRGAPDQRVLIVDPATGVPLPDGNVGEIWLAGTSVAAGYWRRPDETSQTFRALTAQHDGEYLRTGDLGGILDGELYITGRLKDVIIIRGQNHYPGDIERTVEQSHPALQTAACAAFVVEREGEERLVVVCEVRREWLARLDADGIVEIVRERISRDHGLRMESLVLVGPGGVPKTSSGKVRRQACRAAYLAGMLEPAPSGASVS